MILMLLCRPEVCERMQLQMFLWCGSWRRGHEEWRGYHREGMLLLAVRSMHIQVVTGWVPMDRWRSGNPVQSSRNKVSCQCHCPTAFLSAREHVFLVYLVRSSEKKSETLSSKAQSPCSSDGAFHAEPRDSGKTLAESCKGTSLRLPHNVHAFAAICKGSGMDGAGNLLQVHITSPTTLFSPSTKQC